MANARQDKDAGIIAFGNMHDANHGADVCVQHCKESTESIGALIDEWQLHVLYSMPRTPQTSLTSTQRRSLPGSCVCCAVCATLLTSSTTAQAWSSRLQQISCTEVPGHPQNAENAKEVKAAAGAFKAALTQGAEEQEKMGDALTGRGYMHILRTARFTEQQHAEMWVRMKGAGTYSLGAIIIIGALSLTLDAVLGGGLFTLAGAAVPAAYAIKGASSAAAAAAFMAANRMLADGKKTIFDEVNKLKHADMKLMTATCRTTDAVVIMLAVLQRTQKFADDVITACSVQPLNIWGMGHVLTDVRNGVTEVCPTKLPGSTLTSLITTQGKLQQYAPLNDDDVPDASDFVALFNPICKVPEEPIGQDTWGAGHVSVLSRYEGSLKVSVTDLLGFTMGLPQCIGCNTTYVTGCNKVHVRITIVDEEVKPSKEYSWKKWGDRDYVVIRRSHDQELHLVNRAKLSKLL